MHNNFNWKRLALIPLTVIGLVLPMATASLAVCPDDIVALWKLDEPNPAPNDTYIDQIRGNDGTRSGVIEAATGRVGGAQEFNGTDSQINVDADRFFDWAADDSFSIEVWVKTNGPVTTLSPAIGRTVGPAGLQWWTGINGSGTGIFALVDTTGNTANATVTPTVADPIELDDGEWHQIVAVRDGANTKNILYVDGVKQGEVTRTYTAGFNSTTAKVNIGWLDYNSPDLYFKGFIDEPAIYDRALDVLEIQQHHTAGLGGTDACGGAAPFVPLPDDTLALWQLDEPDNPPNDKYVDTFDGNDGTRSGAIEAATGRVGGAQEFNGTDSQINVDADRFFDWAADDSFSIEVWVKTNGPVTTLSPAIGRTVGPAGLQWWTGINGSGTGIFALVDTTGNTANATVTPTVADPIELDDGEWHQIVAVRDGANTKNILYVDGVKQGEVTRTYTAGFNSTTAKVNIGWLDYNSPDLYFKGFIDEPAIYDRALDVLEIQQHYDAGTTGNGIESLRPEPLADAGADQTVALGASVTLDGQNSNDDPYGQIVSWLWEQTAGTAVTLTGANSETATFTAPNAAGTLSFQLTVTDNDGLMDTATVAVTVSDSTTSPPASGGGGGGGGGCFIQSLF